MKYRCPIKPMIQALSELIREHGDNNVTVGQLAESLNKHPGIVGVALADIQITRAKNNKNQSVIRCTLDEVLELKELYG